MVLIRRAKNYIKEYISSHNLSVTDIAETPTPTMPLKKTLQFFDFNENQVIHASSNNPVLSEIIEYQNILIDSNLNVLSFWHNKRKKFPILHSVVKRLFVAQATSTPAERLFSASGYTVWDRRNRLSPSKVNKLMIINQYNKSYSLMNSRIANDQNF